MFNVFKKQSHKLFLYIQKNIATISWVRFAVKLFDKKIDYLLGMFATVLVVSIALHALPYDRIITIGGFLVLFTITTIIKYTVHEPRPFVTYAHVYDSPNHFGKNDSFPSNHAVYFFGIATVASILLGFLVWPLYILALFIALTRIIAEIFGTVPLHH
jgi:membrane-associated phospholipid phosphatase